MKKAQEKVPSPPSDEHDLDFMKKDTEFAYSDSMGLMGTPTIANNLSESMAHLEQKKPKQHE